MVELEEVGSWTMRVVGFVSSGKKEVRKDRSETNKNSEPNRKNLRIRIVRISDRSTNKIGVKNKETFLVPKFFHVPLSTPSQLFTLSFCHS